MGESNADSTIALKLNRLDRRRMATAGGLPNLTIALNDPNVSVVDIFDGTNPLAAATFAALGLTPPISTPREIAHITEVDGDVVGMSKAVIAQVYNHGVPATFSAALGDDWEIELMTNVTPKYVETAILWVNPISPIWNGPV